MKSIMQEASSVAKAIEQGWLKAGQPADFSIKILEQPQKNFFGLTVRPAKIAVYFDEKPTQRYHESHGQRQQQPRKIQVRELHEQPKRPEQRMHEQRSSQQRPQEQRHAMTEQQPEPAQKQGQHNRFEVQWDDAMIAYAQEWLTHVLQESYGKQVSFTIEPNNLYLRITFAGPVLDSQEKRKTAICKPFAVDFRSIKASI